MEDKIWLVSFMKYDIGFFDEMENRVEPATNPFDVIVSPVTYVPGMDPLESGAATRIRTRDLMITNQLLYQLSYCGLCRRTG